MSESNSQSSAVALRRMAEDDPGLAVRLALHSLPLAVKDTNFNLDYGLDVEGVGQYHVSIHEGKANVHEGQNGKSSFQLSADAKTMAQIVAGDNPIKPLLRGKLKIKGSRLKALRLRELSSEGSLRDLAKLGVDVDAELVHRSFAYAIDPEWTVGQHFVVGYEIIGDRGGTWFVHINDGEIKVLDSFDGKPEAVVRVAYSDWLRLLRGELSPALSYATGTTEIDGETHCVTQLGRWLDRAEGRDQSELEREQRQRQIRRQRGGVWGAVIEGQEAVSEPEGAKGPRLMGYEELYALWERQNWRAHELDFSVDHEQWVTTPSEGQAHMAWTMGSFYIGEERVCADLAPFVLAAPSGEVEIFLTTQMVDEARHAVFFDRFAAEVMALESESIRGRLKEMEEKMLAPWRFLFDDQLRETANYLKQHPDDLDAFVEGICIYHMCVEGVNAMTGQSMILGYTRRHGLYPGFQKGFALVEQDEHRHIAFGVRFLRDIVEHDPKYRDLIQRKMIELVPEAAKVFVPPFVEDVREFRSFDIDSRQIYGFAYRALKRRMSIIGVEIPPAEELMPGPIDELEVAAA